MADSKIKPGDWIDYRKPGNRSENLFFAEVVEVRPRTVTVKADGLTFAKAEKVSIKNIQLVNGSKL